MVKITYSSREPPSLTVEGHANYAEYGKDIVCAAVSALCQTLMNALAAYTDDDISVRASPGDSMILWRGRQSKEAALLTMSFLDGMRDIAETYPDYVKYEIL